MLISVSQLPLFRIYRNKGYLRLHHTFSTLVHQLTIIQLLKANCLPNYTMCSAMSCMCHQLLDRCKNYLVKSFDNIKKPHCYIESVPLRKMFFPFEILINEMYFFPSI